MKEIKEQLKNFEGHVGFYYCNLVSDETDGFNEERKFLAASVIKLPIFVCICKWVEEGITSFDEKLSVTNHDRVPSCGALNMFDEDMKVSIRTLCRLMICISDNTATNVLINRFGIDKYNEEFASIGLVNTRLNRLLFDMKASEKGLENYVVPKEIGELLKKIYFKQLPYSDFIMDTLLKQQINHKIPGYLNGKIEVAHKTGEDDCISNDVGIVFAKNPFVVCFMGNDVSVSEYERFIRQSSLQLTVKNC